MIQDYYCPICGRHLGSWGCLDKSTYKCPECGASIDRRDLENKVNKSRWDCITTSGIFTVVFLGIILNFIVFALLDYPA